MVSAQLLYRPGKSDAKYCRYDLLRHFRHLDLHNGILLCSFIGMLAYRIFSDCCPVLPGFATQCLAEEVIDKHPEEK